MDGIQMKLDVRHKPGAVRLDGFPLLSHAPEQWGPGVRTEDRGIPVAEIASASRTEPDPAKLAAQLGTTEAHVRQALAWQQIHGGA